MISFKNLYQQGLSFAEYTKQGNEAERDMVSKITEQLATTNLLSTLLLKRLSLISTPVQLLIVGEMWCSDCRLNITAMQQMSLLQPKIQLAMISKKMAELHLLKLMDLSPIKIPLVAILNENYQLIGTFIERPNAVTEVKKFSQIKVDYKAGSYLECTITDILDGILLS